MNPEEKAKQLYETFYYLMPPYLPEKDKDIVATFSAKKCVEEMLEIIDSKDFHTRGFYQDVSLELKKI